MDNTQTEPSDHLRMKNLLNLHSGRRMENPGATVALNCARSITNRGRAVDKFPNFDEIDQSNVITQLVGKYKV